VNDPRRSDQRSGDDRNSCASIVGDNLPAQVSGLAHWSRIYVLQERRVFIPISNPRAASGTFWQLMMKGTMKKSQLLRNCDDILSNMITAGTITRLRARIKSNCPLPVETRWLSRDNSLLWTLRPQKILMKVDQTDLTGPEKVRYTAMNEGNHRLIWALCTPS
jgi:hypothetical protein